jgi:hypothetical protein
VYGKLFQSMYDGTLTSKGPWQALVTFQQLIGLADRRGMVDMTMDSISRRTTIPLDIIKVGIEALSQPDPDSRSQVEEGRRIILIDAVRTWGWRLVNYEYYRNLRLAEDRREYHREYGSTRRAAKKKKSTKDNKVNHGSTKSTNSISIGISSKDTVSNETVGKPAEPVPPQRCPVQEIVELYHEVLPMGRRVEKVTEARSGRIKQRWRQDLPTLQHWRNYFEDIKRSPFLMGQVQATNGRPPFQVDIDFITTAGNYVQIAEGKYHRG